MKFDDEVADSASQLPTIEGVADQLCVSESTVYRLMASGDLPRRRIRGSTRFTQADIEKLVSRALVEG